MGCEGVGVGEGDGFMFMYKVAISKLNEEKNFEKKNQIICWNPRYTIA